MTARDTGELELMVNKWYWEDLACIHAKQCAQLTDAVVGGASTLRNIELDAVGDPCGKHLLHLMCHLGHDTIAWARLGARVVAVDSSESALAIASQTAARCGLAADFQRVVVPAFPTEWLARFDFILMTYGTLAWLPNLPVWAGSCAACLRPNGRLIVIDDHPLADCLQMSDDGKELVLNRGLLPVRSGRRIRRRTVGSYVDRSEDIPTPVHYRWQHSVTSLVNAILGVGLIVIDHSEYEFTHYPRFPGLVLRSDRYFELLDATPPCPLMFSMVALKPA